MALTRKQLRNFTALFWLDHGRLPAGTDNTTFDDVKMADLQFDDPPIPGKIELETFSALMDFNLNKLGIAVPNIKSILSDDQKTMADLVMYCFTNQKPYNLNW